MYLWTSKDTLLKEYSNFSNSERFVSRHILSETNGDRTMIVIDFKEPEVMMNTYRFEGENYFLRPYIKLGR